MRVRPDRFAGGAPRKLAPSRRIGTMKGRFWIQLAQTTAARPHAGLGSVFPHRGRRGRQARPLLDPLEERCLLSFGSPSLFDTGANNAAVAIGDIDGDGKPDLVTAATSNTLTVALGYGDGRFQPPLSPITIPAVTSFSSVKLADLNGDKKLDIIAADPSGNQVWVLLNQGGGRFGTPTALATGLSPMSIAVADLNGDGNADIITANQNGNSVSILLGNGDGTFQPHQDYTVDSRPLAVAIADFNMDGHPDLVTANSVGNSVTVLLNKGDGTFRPGMDIPITVPQPLPGDVLDVAVSSPSGVAVGDFNGDGYTDLVTANSGWASVTVMLGNGDGSFGVQQTIDTLTYQSNPTDPINPDSPNAVVAADLDGDGFVDIAFTEPKHGSIGLLSGKGDGTFVARVDYVAGESPAALVVANLNGDRTSLGLDRLDLVTVDPKDTRVAVLLGQKYTSTITLTPGLSTITWGGLVGVTPVVSPAYPTQRLPLTGAFQLVVDDKDYSVPQPLGSTFVLNGLPVGRHQLGVRYLGDDDFQPSTTSPSASTITVVAAKLTLAAFDQSRAYGDVNPAFTYSIAGFLNGDFLDRSKLSGAPVFTTTAAGPSSPVGNYVITIAQGLLGYADPNYTFDSSQFHGGKLTITPVPLTISTDNLTRPYGQGNPALKPNYNGFVNGETLVTSDLTGSPSVSTTTTESSPAGSYPIAVARGSLSSSNYILTFQAGTLTITPVLLTVTADAATRAYGAADPTLTPTITGFVNGDTPTANDLTGAPSLVSAAKPTSLVGSYTVTLAQGTLESTNYAFKFQPGTLTVTPAVLTVAAVDATRAYGIPNPALSYTLTGFANGETAATGGVTGTLALSTTAQANSPVGAYPITVGPGALSSTNYAFQGFQPATLTITQAALILQVQDAQKSYGTANPSITYTVVREDQPQTAVSVAAGGLTGAPILSTAAVVTSPVGIYPIAVAPGTLVAGNSNYTLDYANSQPGTLTISQATLTITADNASRAYGAADPAFVYTISGFIQGQSLATSDVTGSPSYGSIAAVTSHVGTYPIVPSLGSLKSQQYTFAFAPGVLKVTPAPLIIAADSTSQSVGFDPMLTASYLGLLNGDTVASLTAPPVLATTATRTSLSGTYSITVSGAVSLDYAITFVPGTLTLVKSSTTSTFVGALIKAAVAPPVTFVVSVTRTGPAAVPLTGVVRFYDGTRVFGDAAVVNGTATLTTSALTQGNHTISAVYQGDGNYAGSAAAPVSQMIFSVAPAARASRSTPVRPPAKKKTHPAPPKHPARAVVKAKSSSLHPAPVKPAASRKTR
jgi:hypothetical protein